MLFRPRFVRALAAALPSFFMIPFVSAETSASTVIVPAKVVGHTPSVIGYNFQGAENLPGSGTSYWLEYSGMTSARLWWPLDAWPADPKRWPAEKNSLAQFEAARAELRADPLKVDWNDHEKRILAEFGGLVPGMTGHAFAFSEARRLGIKPLSPLTVGAWNTLSGKRFPFEDASGQPDWFGRWAYWRGIYLNVFYLARYYDVERFQLFNEPDHPNGMPMTQKEFIARLQIGSDAIRAAVDDVNRVFKKQLRSIVSAPVTAGLDIYRARSGRDDKRDAERGWGEVTMAALDTDFPGRSEPKRPLFDHYAFQNYTKQPSTIAERGERVLAEMRKDRPQGFPPLIVSETNVSTAANFLKTSDTLDTPSFYSAFAAIANEYVKLGLEEFYIFRLTQTANMPNNQVKKNGTHVINPKDPLSRIIRITKGGEAARLFIHALGGGLERMEVPAGLPEGVSMVAARNPQAGVENLLIANTGAARAVKLDFSQWNLAEGTPWVLEEVSALAHGGVTRFGSLSGGALELTLPATSNLALRIGAPFVASGTEALEVKSGRWSLAATPKARWLGFRAKDLNSASRIVRAWVETPEGKRRRILGHVVLGGAAQEQLLALRDDEARAGCLIRLEPDTPDQAPVKADQVLVRALF